MMAPEVFLNVAVVQTDIYWENVTANLSSLEEKITSVDQPFDVLILPEMFSTGFTMNKDAAEPMNLTTTRWMKQMAAQTGALLTGSVAIRESGNCYNRLFCVYPDGRILAADKRHLFRMGRENEVYTRGENRLIVEWKGWKICPLICYDLRFPVWSRNTASDPFDLLIYVANWPARRSYAWNTLLRARAIENQCYVAGVNRVGADAAGTEHQGDSVVLDYLGEPQLLLGNKESIKVVRISKYDLQEYRKIFPAWSDADDFRVLP